MIKKNALDCISIYRTNKSIIDEEVLEVLRETKKQLNIITKMYTIEIDGRDIINSNNILYTDVELKANQEGKQMVVNRGKELPGLITIVFNEEKFPYKHLYLYNNDKKVYQEINVIKGSSFMIDLGGKYLLTEEVILLVPLKKKYITGAILAIVIFICIYILVKRRYWFW